MSFYKLFFVSFSFVCVFPIITSADIIDLPLCSEVIKSSPIPVGTQCITNSCPSERWAHLWERIEGGWKTGYERIDGSVGNISVFDDIAVGVNHNEAVNFCIAKNRSLPRAFEWDSFKQVYERQSFIYLVDNGIAEIYPDMVGKSFWTGMPDGSYTKFMIEFYENFHPRCYPSYGYRSLERVDPSNKKDSFAARCFN